PDVRGQDIKEGRDGRVGVLLGRPGHDDVAVAQVEGDTAAGMDPERLTDRLGQGDLALRGDGGGGSNMWHWHSPDLANVRMPPYLVKSSAPRIRYATSSGSNT